ncbi:hypothetical protein CEXT_428301 [Caerostris extrusa]|uniref:Uncharacterized protein n=1 Tax=Caerostris extrusa TaxID=172846 RepID=A0AAV4X7B0_CAEEX|nr:hypothetical protein CEXT_428301 [Caerostris extrusa]
MHSSFYALPVAEIGGCNFRPIGNRMAEFLAIYSGGSPFAERSGRLASDKASNAHPLQNRKKKEGSRAGFTLDLGSDLRIKANSHRIFKRNRICYWKKERISEKIRRGIWRVPLRVAS